MDFVFFPVLYLSYLWLFCLASLSILLTFEEIELQELIYIGGDALGDESIVFVFAIRFVYSLVFIGKA